MQHHLSPGLSVDEAAQALGCSPQTVRRLLRAGRVEGRKLGREWVVWFTAETSAVRMSGHRAQKSDITLQQPTTTTIRKRLREVGTLLIAVGNHMAQARKGRGQLFLTRRTPHALRITLAIGRQSLTKGWSPYVLGVELPFWLAERTHWRQVMPLLRRYEQIRSWCAPRLLRIAGVGEAVLAELRRLETALQAMAETMPAQEPQACNDKEQVGVTVAAQCTPARGSEPKAEALEE
jgi:excisionase family DNA binding protein